MRFRLKPTAFVCCLALLWLLLLPPALPAIALGTGSAFDDPTNNDSASLVPKSGPQILPLPTAVVLPTPPDGLDHAQKPARTVPHHHPAFTGESRAPPAR